MPRIAEIDLNPVLVHPAGEGLSLIDARVRLVQDARANGVKNTRQSCIVSKCEEKRLALQTFAMLHNYHS